MRTFVKELSGILDCKKIEYKDGEIGIEVDYKDNKIYNLDEVDYVVLTADEFKDIIREVEIKSPLKKAKKQTEEIVK